jgi:hypothetical protein
VVVVTKRRSSASRLEPTVCLGSRVTVIQTVAGGQPSEKQTIDFQKWKELREHKGNGFA